GNQHLVPSSVTIVSPPQHGQAVFDLLTNQMKYTANPGWSSTDTFRYTVSDDNGATSAPATVTVITMIPIVSKGMGVISGPGTATFNVLAAAIDPLTAGALANATVSVISGPRHGQVTTDTSGNLVYTPDPHFVGTDTFTYTITDAQGATSAPAKITIDVLPPLPPKVLS